MKNISILPADTYKVVNKSLLNEENKLVLNLLYMPLIGNTAMGLYLTLYNEIKTNTYVSYEFTHHHLMSCMNLSLREIKEARIKLEGIGLLKTYYKEGSINEIIYELYSPITSYEFFNHPIFNVTLYNYLGKEEYTRIKSYFRMPNINLDGFIDITSAFDMTFKSKGVNNIKFEEYELIKKEVGRLKYENEYDFDTLIDGLPKNLFSNKAFNKSVKELIRDLSFLYNIDIFDMQSILKSSVNEKGLIDKDTLKKSARSYYEINNDGKLPSLIFNSQPEYLRSPLGDLSNRGKMINVFETLSPYKYLRHKNNGVKPSMRDMKILEDLITEYKLTPAVVNVLVDYVLRTNNGKLNKNYAETIASHWKRCNIETAKEAMEIAEKEHKKYNKNSKVQNKKEEIMPSWFNKNISSSEISEEEMKEFEDLVKEFK